MIAVLVIAAALLNWRPLVEQPLFQGLEDILSTWIVGALVPVEPRPAASGAESGHRFPPRRLLAVGPDELIRLWQRGKALPRNAFVILANSPLDYQWRPPAQRRWLLSASTEAAVALGVDAVVDASAADHLRASEPGRQSAGRLRAAGIIRAVILDGGHHLPALTLEPEIAVLPVLHWRGKLYACHAHLRDAVPVDALRDYAAQAGLRTQFFTTPRLLTMAKTKKAMAALLGKVLTGMSTSPLPPRAAAEIPCCPDLSVSMSAVDILRERVFGKR